MNDKDYWNIFQSTGKIEDYLNFKQVVDTEQTQGGNNADNPNGRTNYKGTEGRRKRSSDYNNYS